MKMVIPSQICIQGDSQIGVLFNICYGSVTESLQSLKAGFLCLDIH